MREILIKLVEKYGGTYQSWAISEVLAQLKSELKAKLPKEKNFNSEVCEYRDDANLIKEIRGKCKGFNECLAQIHKIIDEA